MFPVLQNPPTSYAVLCLAAMTTHVPQLLTVELRRRTLRPLALCAIGVYGVLCLALAALALVVRA